MRCCGKMIEKKLLIQKNSRCFFFSADFSIYKIIFSKKKLQFLTRLVKIKKIIIKDIAVLNFVAQCFTSMF